MRILLVLIGGVLLAACGSIGSKEGQISDSNKSQFDDYTPIQITQGMTFEWDMPFGYGNTRLALPIGKWEVAGTEEAKNKQGFRIGKVYLVRRHNNRVIETVNASANLETGGKVGISLPKECKKNRYFYRKMRGAAAGGDQDCRWVGLARPRYHTEKAENGLFQQVRKYVRTQNLVMPAAVVHAGLHRADIDSFLKARYGRDPELDGVPPPENEKRPLLGWGLSKLGADVLKLNVMETMAKFTDEFFDLFEAGFQGKSIPLHKR